MNLDLSKHPFFEPWIDPASGITSFILTKRVAPVQQSFYFLTPSLSADERWLWFYAAVPPSPHRMLGAVSMDSSDPRILLFPASAGCGESPLVAPEGDAAYFALPPSVWRQPVAGQAEVVCTLPPDLAPERGRQVTRMVSHLTLSADGRRFVLDGERGLHWFVAIGDLQTGRITLLKEFGRKYNHAQFSPVDPNLFLIAQDWWIDPISGQEFPYDHRMWLMDVPQTRFEPVCPTHWATMARAIVTSGGRRTGGSAGWIMTRACSRSNWPRPASPERSGRDRCATPTAIAPGGSGAPTSRPTSGM